jgi:hypothetical protein
LSLIVQKKFRRLGDRLLGIVELSSHDKAQTNFSPELYRAAIHQVADETAQFDFREAVDEAHSKKLFFATIALVILVALPAVVVPAVSRNVFHRWIAPFAAIPRYTLVQLDLPGKIIVPHGEDFSLNGTVKFRSFWKPSRAIAQFEKQNPVAAKLNGNKFVFQIPAQVQDGKLRVKVGDATREVAVVPTFRSALKQIAAEIQLPKYLELLPTNQPINNGILNLIEGSQFSLRGKISRELVSARIQLGEKNDALRTEKDEFFSGVFDSHSQDANDAVLQYAFNWRDTLGLSNATPWRLSVRPQKDFNAAASIPDLPSDVAILVADVLEVRTQAKDDFGVRELGLSWDFAGDSEHPVGSRTTEVKVEPKLHHEKTFEKTFRWSPSIYQIPEGSSIELFAFSRDFFPERERAESSAHRIHVLGKEQHAELIRQKLESLMSRVEEIARLEEKVMANTDELQANEKLSREQKAGRIHDAGEDQERNKKNLDQLANEGLATLHEALKNPIFTEQILKDWATTLEALQKLADNPMKSAAENLQSAEKNSDAQSQKKDLAEARKKEQEALDALQKMQGRANQNLDDLQALTLAERLRRVGATETEISGSLQKIIPDTIGMLPKELPEKFRAVSVALTAKQSAAHDESQSLQKEISRFFERTQKKNYGDVSKEIVEAKTVDELERVGGLIHQNISMEATKNLGAWAERFAKWAEKLEPPKEESASGQGQGQAGKAPKDMTKTLVALLRLREKELTLREKTELLDGQRGDQPNYKQRADELFQEQKKIGGTLDGLAKGNDLPPLIEPYRQTGDAMKEIESFLAKPQTDKTTLSAQVKSVDLLTDLINLINEQAKRQNPKSQSQQEQANQTTAEQMAFLMQMAQQNKPGDKMTMSQSGGGNRAGGTTDKTGAGVNGDVNGANGESRRVQKASGTAGATLPEEFRDTLESYFKAVEQESH